jgi:hypothetical protein
MTTTTRTSTLLAALAVTAATLTGCSTESEMRAQDPAASQAPSDTAGESPTAVPTAVPVVEGELATRGLVTVLDDGDGPELCHSVAESMPPQCSGPKITGWDWAAHPEHEDQGGVRWGSFHLTGTFDGATFAVSDAIPAALYDAMNEPEEEPLGTPCDEPEGGWVVDDDARSPEDMDATLNAAAALPGYAMAWLDDQVVNVAVTEDPEGAEATLRETWGGALCVSEAEHTEDELQAIQLELNTLPGLLSSGSDRPDHLAADVLLDDGSMQEWADATYGEGLVTVTSALAPVAAG